MGALSSLKKAKPLYSAFDEALTNIKRPKGTGIEFLTEVMKQPGVKKAEVEDRKLKQAFEKAGKMTKEEAQALAQKHAPAKLEEKVLSEPSLKDIEARASEMAFDDAVEEARDAGYRSGDLDQVVEEIHDDIMSNPDLIGEYMERAAEDLMESGVSPQHGEWTLPGGENYREILLKTPAFAGDKKIMELEAMRRRVDPEFHTNRYNELTQQIDELKSQKAQHPEQFQGVSAHFAGEPGIIASLRVKDRVGPKGEKVLHIEEIQSDWHQQGRKKGYRNPDAINAYAEYEKGLPERTLNKITDMFIESGTEPERARALAEKQLKTVLSMSRERNLGPSNMAAILGEEKQMKNLWDAAIAEKEKTPDAPFKKNWQELALKKALNYAAENGYDKIAITPGVEQANRYNLSKQVEQITATQEDGKFRLFARDLQGKNHDMGAFEPEKLPDVVGKDLASKISAQEKPYDIYQGVDLEVGGEGMKGFYDKILPGYLNEFGKKHGVKVGELDIETHPASGFHVRNTEDETRDPTRFMFATDAQNWHRANNLPDTHVVEPIPAKFSKVHSFDITPEMREEITTKGLPLYQQIGLPLGTGVGSYEFNAPEPEYAAGGAVNYNTDPDMSDGGEIIQGAPYKKGGKVRITDNLDEMFMEVNSKKFQRK